MSDYIKREDATAVISKTLGSLGNSVVTEINSLSGYVADRPTGWIPVTERLPKEHGAYLVTFPMMLKDTMSVTILLYGKPLMPNTEIKEVCWYDSDSEYGDIVYDDVVAWMPLPPVYQGERRDGEV